MFEGEVDFEGESLMFAVAGFWALSPEASFFA
jgi:hypothetical protein